MQSNQNILDKNNPVCFVSGLMNKDLIVYCAVMFVSALAGGLVMLVRRWSDELLHAFLSFGAGIFMGAVFMHLLPEAMSYHQPARMGMLLMIGFLTIAFVEQCVPHVGLGNGHSRHKIVSITALVGLSIHSLIEGFALAVAMSNPDLARILFFSIVAHKVPAAFALGSLMALGGHSRKRMVFSLLAFAAMAPIGAMALAPMLEGAGDELLMSLIGIVSGSFLYVATGSLLPEVFHSRKKLWLNLILLLAGILMISMISFRLGHSHY